MFGTLQANSVNDILTFFETSFLTIKLVQQVRI